MDLRLDHGIAFAQFACLGLLGMRKRDQQQRGPETKGGRRQQSAEVEIGDAQRAADHQPERHPIERNPGFFAEIRQAPTAGTGVRVPTFVHHRAAREPGRVHRQRDRNAIAGCGGKQHGRIDNDTERGAVREPVGNEKAARERPVGRRRADHGSVVRMDGIEHLAQLACRRSGGRRASGIACGGEHADPRVGIRGRNDRSSNRAGSVEQVDYVTAQRTVVGSGMGIVQRIRGREDGAGIAQLPRDGQAQRRRPGGDLAVRLVERVVPGIHEQGRRERQAEDRRDQVADRPRILSRALHLAQTVLRAATR
ncbi:MAG: hypothetical protein AB7Q97_12850 [Gammaproteobacteria bacterium]